MKQTITEVQASPRPLVRWSSVFAGTVIGLALTLLFASLWVALAFGSRNSLFYNHMAWWLAGTAIGTTFVAAWIAAIVADRGGAAAGLAHGGTTWGLLVLGTVAAGVPSLVAFGATRAITVNGIHVAVTTVQPWTTFWALLIALGAAALGGLMGGVMRRRPPAVVDVREPAAERTDERTSELAEERTAERTGPVLTREPVRSGR